MKTKTIITDITQEDLVNLLSTALSGSDYFGADYDSNEYRKIPNPDDCECFEEKLAKMLLNGKTITISDAYVEDEEDFHGDLWHEWDNESSTMDYTINLENIKKGLQKCIDGTFKENEGCGDEKSYMRKCVNDLMYEDSMELDLYEAENIMQIIVFGELVYG